MACARLNVDYAVNLAAFRLGARRADVRGYYEAGGDWDAGTTEELADLICECWREQGQEVEVADEA